MADRGSLGGRAAIGQRRGPILEPPIHAAVDELHAHPRHTGLRWFDLTVAMTAIFISAVSLFVAIEHGRTERALVAANSWPFVQAEINVSYAGTASISLGNAGVGPAKLEMFELYYQGTPFLTARDLLHRCCGLPLQTAAATVGSWHGIGVGSGTDAVLRPGEHQVILQISRLSQEPSLHDRFVQVMQSFTYRACYCSVFDECWLSELTNLHPRRVAACPVSHHPFSEREAS